MYGVRGIRVRSVTTHVTRNATVDTVANATSAASQVKP
jgi:hypothetical protein